MEFRRESSSEWVEITTNWIIDTVSESSTPPVKQIVTETTRSWGELPQDVRDAYLRKQKMPDQIDITETRDKELMGMAY